MKTKTRNARNSPARFTLCIVVTLLSAAGGLKFGGNARATDFYWINASGGDWSNTNNWSPSRITPPADGDNVYITLSGSYTVTGSGSASFLQLGDGVASFPTLLLNSTGVSVSGSASAGAGSHIILDGGDGSSLFGGGSFSANGGLALYGEIDWLAGSLNGSVTVATNGLIASSTSLNHLFAANIYNHGRILWSADNLTSDGSWLQNMPDGILDFQNDCNFTTFGGASSPNVVITHGTLLKSAGTNLLYFGGPYYVTNTGVVKIGIGTLELLNNVSVGGTFVVSNGAALWLESGTFTLNPGYAFTGSGFYGVPSDGNIVLNGTMTDPNFQMNGAVSGTNTIAGTMNCYDGNFQGATTVAANGILNLNGCSNCGSVYSSTQTGGVLTNAGTINWLSGDWKAEGGIFVNLSNALFRIQCDNTLGSFNGYGNWFNAGIFRKTAGTGTNSLVGVVFNNAGLVDAQSGGLLFPNGFTSSGTFNAAGGAAILLEGGTFNLNPGAAFTGAGFYGVPGGTYISVSGSIPGANFQMNGTLSATNTITGTMNCYDGSFQGATTIAANGVLNLNGCSNCGSVYYSTQTGGVLTNAGTINWLSGDWTAEGGIFVNLSNALFGIQCDNTLGSFGGYGNWFNAGTFRKTAGAGTNSLGGLVFNNAGLVDAQSGGLLFPNGLTNSGTFNALSGAAVLFSSGAFYLNPGTVFTGGGFYGIPADGNSSIYGSIAGTNFQVRGVLHGTNTVSGTMWCSGGALGDSITVAPGAVLSLFHPAMFSGVITNAGRVNWLAGDWPWGASTLVNQPGGLFDIQCDGTESVSFNQPAAILNAGTIRKSAGGGASYFQSSTAVTNTGLLDVQSGTVQIQGPYGQTGGQLNFGLAGPFQYGQLNINDTLTLTGELSANFIGAYAPAAGDTFNILTTAGSTGVFASLGLPALPGVQTWSENYGTNVTSLIVNHGPPRLVIGASGGGLNISWSTNADAGFVLQSATNLAPPIVWQNVTNKPQTVGNQNVLALPMSNNASYFRLQE